MLKKKLSQLIQIILIISTLLIVVSCTSTHKTEHSVSNKTLSVIDKYRIEIAYKIQNSWESLSDLDDSVAELMALVVIKVMPNGEIKDFLFVKRSGNNHFDELVLKSVMKYNPTDHHPDSISEPYVEIGLRFTFDGIR